MKSEVGGGTIVGNDAGGSLKSEAEGSVRRIDGDAIAGLQSAIPDFVFVVDRSLRVKIESQTAVFCECLMMSLRVDEVRLLLIALQEDDFLCVPLN